MTGGDIFGLGWLGIVALLFANLAWHELKEGAK